MKLHEILRLARSGARERAWAALAEGGALTSSDPKVLTLKARLIKDRAKRAPRDQAARLFAEAAGVYAQAARQGNASYPLINAATLLLLAGQRRRAEQGALQVLDLLDASPDEAETPYWLGATRAEALLLLGKLTEARAALRAAVAEAPLAWEDRAATIGQFVLICEELPCDAAWLDPFRPPRSVQYSGIMGVPQSDAAAERRIAEWLKAENVGFGFGALAAGADIWIAEALVERSAALNVVLPCPVEVFREKSVAAVDPAWLPRFDRLLEAADTVDELDAAPGPSPTPVSMNDAVALGLAVHNARILQSEPLRLRIAGDPEPRAAGDPGPARGVTLVVARQPGTRVFHVGEAGVARAMLRAARTADARESVEFFDSPSQAWSAARLRAGVGQSVALDYRFIGEGPDQAEPIARLEALAEVAEAGQILASKALAFALLAEAPQVRVEPLGEVRSAGGFFPVYALA
jgi:hypothetical protein